MFTEKYDEKMEWTKEFKGNIQYEVIPDAEDLKHQMRYCKLFLLPLNVSSPLFGTEALSAIAVGVPILVSGHSAVGSLLLEIDANNSVVSETEEHRWIHRISQKIANPDEAQREANNLKDQLLLDTKIPSTHLDFINIITGVYSYTSLLSEFYSFVTLNKAKSQVLK